jgi:hypothetical protein
MWASFIRGNRLISTNSPSNISWSDWTSGERTMTSGNAWAVPAGGSPFIEESLGSLTECFGLGIQVDKVVGIKVFYRIKVTDAWK